METTYWCQEDNMKKPCMSLMFVQNEKQKGWIKVISENSGGLDLHFGCQWQPSWQLCAAQSLSFIF